MFRFANPYYFLFLIPIVLWFLRLHKRKGLKIPSISNVKSQKLKTKKHLISRYLFLISLILMVIALARPQIVSQRGEIKKNAIDIVITLDLSQSMLTDDFKPNRIEKAKELLKYFIEKRINDRVGLVIFGGDAYTKIPLTFDHTVLTNTLAKISVNDIMSNDRTAIGMGMGVSLNRLKNSNSKSKIIILMTDGENNSGEMSPTSAATIAKDLGIKIYTIGIGAYERNIDTFFGTQKVANTELDENLLKKIAADTNGQYFRASNSNEFKNIFDKLDALEKTQIDSLEYFSERELYEIFLIIALILLAIGIGLEYLLFIKIP